MMQLVRRLALIILCAALSGAAVVLAQDDAPGLALAVEYDIGFDCPVASAAQPDSDVFWVLMDNCRDKDFSLHAYSLKTGEPLDRAPIALDNSDGGLSYMDSFAQPMGFTPEDRIEIYSFTTDTYNRRTTQVDIDSGAITTDAEADQRADALVRQVSDYPEQAIYSPDHAFAATAGEANLHIIDLVNERILFEVEAQYGLAIFSPDSQHVYISAFDEPDNMDNNNATVFVYRLPDGEQTRSVHLPTAFIYPSPDGRYFAAQIDESQLAVVDAGTGETSALLEMWEPEGKAPRCENDGRSLADVDFIRSGRLRLVAVQWLPDSSGFYTLNSYGGEAVGGGRLCNLNHSRLRQYIIETP